MARLAAGMADDLLTTLCLATEMPIVIAPAMNRLMWANAATRANADRLAERGLTLLGPGEGSQACGEVGPGRMLEPLQIVEALDNLLLREGGLLAGLSVLITAGPTREPIDPVRYISNRSSGKMGFAVAGAARRQGADVTLISGPVRLATPSGVDRVSVETAEEMHAEVRRRAAGMDIFVATAAVADYRVRERASQKIKKSAEELSLDLIRNPDILAAVAAMERGPFTVGFAAETHDVLAHAESKRSRKGLDMIAANEVGEELAFDRDDNALHVLWDGGARDLPKAPKVRLATELVALIAERYRARD
jgi:phosphopantothenoylcysteine decarboxylase/phosphopantothenate--cysteine ligase